MLHLSSHRGLLLIDSSPWGEILYKCSISPGNCICLRTLWCQNMKGLGLVVLVLLLMLSAVEADDAEMQYWTCGYRGLCRRFCYAQEYIVGHHGCPRRYRCCAMRF